MAAGRIGTAVQPDWNQYSEYLVDARKEIFTALFNAFHENQEHTDNQNVKDQANVLSEIKERIDGFSLISRIQSKSIRDIEDFSLINHHYQELLDNFKKIYKRICTKIYGDLYFKDILSDDKKNICLFYIKMTRFIDEQFYLHLKIKELAIPSFIEKANEYQVFLDDILNVQQSVEGLNFFQCEKHISECLYDLEATLYKKGYVTSSKFQALSLSYDNPMRAKLSDIARELAKQSDISSIIHRKHSKENDSSEISSIKSLELNDIKVRLGLALKKISLETQVKLRSFDDLQKNHISKLNTIEAYIKDFLKALSDIEQARHSVSDFYNIDPTVTNQEDTIEYGLNLIANKSKLERIPIFSVNKGWGDASDIIRKQLYEHIKFVFDGVIFQYGNSLEVAKSFEDKISRIRLKYNAQERNAISLNNSINEIQSFYDERVAPALQATLKRLSRREIGYRDVLQAWPYLLTAVAVITAASFAAAFFLAAFTLVSASTIAACMLVTSAGIGLLGVYGYKIKAEENFEDAVKLEDLKEPLTIFPEDSDSEDMLLSSVESECESDKQRNARSEEESDSDNVLVERMPTASEIGLFSSSSHLQQQEPSNDRRQRFGDF